MFALRRSTASTVARSVCTLGLLCLASPLLHRHGGAEAMEIEYLFSGTVAWAGAYSENGFPVSFPADVTPGATMSGSLRIDGSVTPTNSNVDGTWNQYKGAIVSLETTIGNTTYRLADVLSKYRYDEWSSDESLTFANDWDYYNNQSEYHDSFFAGGGSWDFRDSKAHLSAVMGIQLESKGPTAPDVMSTSLLPGMPLDVDTFTDRYFYYIDYNIDDTASWPHRVNTYQNLRATITSLTARTTLGDVSGGAVTLPAGVTGVVGTASGGTIDASVGSATVSSLAGATLVTGAGGATVTTLTSGVLTIGSGTVSVAGGTFTGHVDGAGSLRKTGSGTLTLAGPNTYSGGTTITAGTLEVATGGTLGSGTVEIARDGRLIVAAGVAVGDTVLSRGSALGYRHAFGEGEDLSHYGTFTDGFTFATLVAGDLNGDTVVDTRFQGWYGMTLTGLDYKTFMMAMKGPGGIPHDAMHDGFSDYYLGYYDSASNTWRNAVEGNHGSVGIWGGYHAGSYQDFLADHGGTFDAGAMRGAWGVDEANGEVWAVIDHNTQFGVATAGGLVALPEPSTLTMLAVGACAGAWRLRRRRD